MTVSRHYLKKKKKISTWLEKLFRKTQRYDNIIEEIDLNPSSLVRLLKE